jgi:hypothetical protein
MFVVVFAFPISAPLAQTPSFNDHLPIREEEKTPRSLKAQRVALEQLHDILRKYPEPHDAYISIAAIGNEETVPLLLERFRLDYGPLELEPTLGVMHGFICTQVHLVDALRTITNTDQGMYYPRWAAWWEANRSLSEHRWILDGFTSADMHVTDPVDEKFGLELIELLGREHSYRAFNANRLLEYARPDLRAEWVARASESAERSRRLGAIAVLRQIDTTGREDLLRRLAADSDVEVRGDALTALNDRLRNAPSSSTGARILLRGSRENWIRAVFFAGDLLVAAFRDGTVQALDARSLQTRWTRRVTPGAGDQVVVAEDRVILASQEGDLVSLDWQGRELWHRDAGDENNEIRRLIHRGDEVVVVHLRSLEQLELKTGKIGKAKFTIPAADFITDADSSQSFGFFIDGWGLRSFSDGASPGQPFSKAVGVSVVQESVCVTYGGSDNRVTCLTPDTLSPRWTRSVGSNGTWGHSVAPILDGSRVIVTTDSSFTAFRASDGAMLWTSHGGQETHGKTLPTGYGLLTQNYNYKLELRDPSTGEVRRVWPQIQGVARLAVEQNFALVADLDDALWLVDLSDPGGTAPPLLHRSP